MLFIILLLSLLSTPAFAGTVVLATDDFNRTDNVDLGTAWDPSKGTFKIASNNAKTTDLGADTAELNNTVTWPDDQYSRVVLGTVDTHTVGLGYGPGARLGTNSGYRVVGNTSGWELSRYTANVFTFIANGTSPTFATGDVIDFQVTGQAVVAFVMRKALAASPTVFVEFGAGNSDSSVGRVLSGSAGVTESADVTAAAGIDSWEGGGFTASHGAPFIFQ